MCWEHPDHPHTKQLKANAKFQWANGQNAYEEALALYQEALELYTEVRLQYALSMCASGCIALRLIFAGCAFCGS